MENEEVSMQGPESYVPHLKMSQKPPKHLYSVLERRKCHIKNV